MCKKHPYTSAKQHSSQRAHTHIMTWKSIFTDSSAKCSRYISRVCLYSLLHLSIERGIVCQGCKSILTRLSLKCFSNTHTARARKTKNCIYLMACVRVVYACSPNDNHWSEWQASEKNAHRNILKCINKAMPSRESVCGDWMNEWTNEQFNGLYGSR